MLLDQVIAFKLHSIGMLTLGESLLSQCYCNEVNGWFTVRDALGLTK